MAPTRLSRMTASRSAKLPKDPKEQFKRRASEFIRKVSNKDRYAIFLEPVDLQQIPGYAEVIKRPMDLSTVQKNLDMGVYRMPEEMRADLDLIWSNCCTFNADDSSYFREAVRLRALSARYYDDLIRQLTRDGVATALGLAIPPRPPRPVGARAAAKGPSRRGVVSKDMLNTSSQQQYSGNELVEEAIMRPGESGTQSGGVSTAGMAGARHERLRRARAEYDAAVSAVKDAKTEVAQAAGKAGIPVPLDATVEAVDSAQTPPNANAPLEIFDGPSAILRKSPKGIAVAKDAHLFTLANNDRVRDRCAAVPSTWRRIGRWHAPGSTVSPFLSEERARNVRYGRQWERTVERSGTIARRLLASVLDPYAVQEYDTVHAGVAISTASQEASVSGDFITNGAVSMNEMRRYNGMEARSHAEAQAVTHHDLKGCARSNENAAAKAGLKRPRLLSTDSTQNREANAIGDDGVTFLADILGTERARKAMRTSPVQFDISKAEAAPPSKAAVGRLRTLLKSKGMDPTFVSALVTQDDNCLNGNNDSAVDDIRDVALRDEKLNNLLHVNYETMMNALRLRALRDSVNEAEREEVEDRERECAEIVAKGVALAVKQLPPKFMIHPLDAAATASQLCNAIQPNSTTTNEH